jgi:hypothetical protein
MCYIKNNVGVEKNHVTQNKDVLLVEESRCVK